jgi:hypothetical protein
MTWNEAIRRLFFLLPRSVCAALPFEGVRDPSECWLAGHLLHWEEPERVARDLAAFVDRF